LRIETFCSERWWLQPLIGSLDDLQLFVGALPLTPLPTTPR
jgi:hypothetical protein